MQSRDQKRQEAQDRKAGRESRSDQQQVDRLNNGKYRALKERAKLEKRITK